MKKFVGVLALSAIAATSQIQAAEQAVQVLQIPGMNTQIGAVKVEEAIRKLPGVTQVKADSDQEAAIIVYDPAQVDWVQFESAVKASGYLATQAKGDFRCPDCKAMYAKAGECILCKTSLERSTQA